MASTAVQIYNYSPSELYDVKKKSSKILAPSDGLDLAGESFALPSVPDVSMLYLSTF